jgi:hypothetical protein
MDSNVKGHEDEIAQVLSELPSSDKPSATGKAGVEEVLKNKSKEVVIKMVIRSRLKKGTVKEAEIEKEMENKVNDNKQVLSTTVYEKKDGKFTKEAIVKYLYEKEIGKSHQFMNKEEKEDEKPNTPEEQGHFSKHK